MNDFYMANWTKLRHIEGASQRVQEDTMRFSSTVEGLGVGFVRAIMTLIAFLPVLFSFSQTITELPIIGEIPHALVWAAFLWSLFGTGVLALIGIKLPGLEFRNQRVEAAYRKELVYGEDDEGRARPATMLKLFANVRKELFPAVLPLPLFQHRPHLLSAGGQHLRPRGADPVDRCGQGHARRLSRRSVTCSIRCAARSSISSIRGRPSWS